MRQRFMNIEILHDFLSIAETMNLTQSAEARRTTQSNLSKRIRQLELWLGRDLIDRRSRPLALGGNTIWALASGGVAALHSGEAARHFAEQVDLEGIPRDRVTLVALGPRIAASAGSGWHAIHIADRPEEGALLALARQVCQAPGHGASTGRGGS